MFTGIVQGTCLLTARNEHEGLYQYHFRFEDDQSDTSIGASVAINGTCLTVVKVEQKNLYFDLIQQTLDTTTLGQLKVGDQANFEHAAKIGDEIGGHLLSGHIQCQGTVVELKPTQNNLGVVIEIPESWARYVFDKGYVAIDGASLTVAEKASTKFRVQLIPETLRATILGKLKPGDKVNIEVDSQTQAVVETVERVLPQLLER